MKSVNFILQSIALYIVWMFGVAAFNLIRDTDKASAADLPGASCLGPNNIPDAEWTRNFEAQHPGLQLTEFYMNLALATAAKVSQAELDKVYLAVNLVNPRSGAPAAAYAFKVSCEATRAVAHMRGTK